MKMAFTRPRPRLALAALTTVFSLGLPLRVAAHTDACEIPHRHGQDRVNVETRFGTIRLELYAGVAPTTVANFLGYLERGDYENSVIHRTSHSSQTPPILQLGGYTHAGSFFDPVPTLEPIDDEPCLSNVTGTIAMARTSELDSATSQWFINLADNIHLDVPPDDPDDDGFTVFGRVLGNSLDVANEIDAALLRAIGQHPVHPIFLTIYDLDDPRLDSIVKATRIEDLVDFPNDLGCLVPGQMGRLLIEDPQTVSDQEPHPGYGLPFYLVSPSCDVDPPAGGGDDLLIDCVGERRVLRLNSQLQPIPTAVSEDAPLGFMEFEPISCDGIAASDASYARRLGASSIQLPDLLVTVSIPEPGGPLLQAAALLAVIALCRATARRA